MDSSIAPCLSAVTPFMSDLQIQLVNQIDQGVSYREIYWTVLRMARDLRDLGEDVVQFDPDIILDAFSDYTSQREMMLLLHSIPRPVLRSIVMRMVAHDFWERDSESRKLLYDAEGPGAYIASVSVVGRDGCGWSIAENSQIVTYLEQYAHAIDLKEKDEDHYGGSPYSDDDVAAFRVSEEIDKVDDTTTEDSQSQNFSMPRFASSSRKNKSRHVWQLIALLKKRDDPNAPQKEPCKQCFCMVGNSDDGLLVSCLKYAGFEVQDTIVPICKAWRIDHINLSEILLTVLAGSLVSVGGLNVKQPGTKSEKNPPSDRAFEGCRLHVWRGNPWFEENLVHSYPQMKEYIDAESELGQSSQADLEQLFERVQYAETKDDELMRFLAFEDSVEDYAEDSVEDTNEQPAGTIPDRTRTRYASV
ncbi:hypothetical protein F4820DRAFT_456552 [Hypoxylon rubiginosum]|uniref:Uncharacterized protein n=1 Tax=Hypoxylon rubiginosum TaxID=110542 RepID=A0ACB9ZBU7_9PEZI|nr:hypothetical protein F4820DRAFT_456552 [Hypoxylon rubiginosum]